MIEDDLAFAKQFVVLIERVDDLCGDRRPRCHGEIASLIFSGVGWGGRAFAGRGQAREHVGRT